MPSQVSPWQVKSHVGHDSQVLWHVGTPLQVCVPSTVKLQPAPPSQVTEPSHVRSGSSQVLFQQV